jgi:hypothetical protein
MEIETIFRKAKKIMMEQGSHPPMVLIECENDIYLRLIPNPRSLWNDSSTQGRCQVLFRLGQEFAQAEYQGAETIRHLCLVTEIWFVSRPVKEANKVTKPSNEPDRREGIQVLSLRPEEMKEDIILAEVIRHGTSVDLLPYTGDIQKVQSPLLKSFLAGVKSAH